MLASPRVSPIESRRHSRSASNVSHTTSVSSSGKTEVAARSGGQPPTVSPVLEFGRVDELGSWDHGIPALPSLHVSNKATERGKEFARLLLHTVARDLVQGGNDDARN
eukprot:GABV01003918.1.p2 GENE.GABV01003918.1~~GABV01003918.1.p2  ORF type:complete len:108 (-),score=21.33 GABV01003918.1:36-359(-)